MAERRFPIGAEPQEDGVHFRVWAPRRKRVAVALEGGATIALEAEERGYFSGLVREAKVGSRYRFALDDDGAFPDPASRYQPEGPHGPSQVVAPKHRWGDADYRGPGKEGQLIYELHVGTFTREGTYRAAAEQLDHLADVGVTVIELMPVAEFPGRFGWGYDGVDLFAPSHLYGEPDDLRAFIDAAHARGIGVILDVVYNHLGPSGNYLRCYALEYFTDKYENEWGDAINFDGPKSEHVREFFVTNARYWIEEFHFDGLRLDATQQIFDDGPLHVVAEITRAVRDAAGEKHTLIVAENEPQESVIVRPVEHGGHDVDMLWNDDFHHTAHVAATGFDEAYYSDYGGTPQELLSALKWGYLFQGQRYLWQKKRRGMPALDLEPWRFVTFVQNHDQIANSARGERLDKLTSPSTLRAVTALVLLGPGTPMLFQGQEFGASQPFLYFADHEPELARLVHEGRREFLSQFPSVASLGDLVDPPDAPATFAKCKLDHAERQKNEPVCSLHRDLARIRRELRGKCDGAILSQSAFLLRFMTGRSMTRRSMTGRSVTGSDDHLVLVNLGHRLTLERIPEPLLAPPQGGRWELRWSSEDPLYGGHGVAPVETEEGSFILPAQSTSLLVARVAEEPR
jgi:maltooligosyltrehalose trehalohydrolase